MSIEGFDVTMRLDGAEVALSDYLGSYRQDDGFFPFFVQHGEDRFQTAPEDGSPFVMRSGDRLIIGVAVYLLRES